MEGSATGRLTVSRTEILTELVNCREECSAVGIWSRCLGKGMFMCFVKEVVVDEDEDDVVVILDENDLSGSDFESHVLYLKEIEKIYKFRTTPNSTLKIHSLGSDDD